MASLYARIMSLGDGSEGTGPAVCLSVLRRAQYSNDEKPLMQVLVNCGECACRILNETRTKLSRVSHVLVTRCEPTRISGISSLLFHLSDKGSASLSFVGPTPLHSYIETVRTFVRRRFPEIEVAEVGAEGDKGFAFNSSSDDPDTFAWAQSRAPHTGVSIHAIPMTATSNKRQKTLHGDCIENSSSRSRPVLSYAFLIRGPPPQPHKDSDANATRQTLFVVVDHADEQVDASQVCQAITSWLEQMEMKSKDGKLRDDLHQRVMLHLGTRSVLESAEFRSLRERDVFQLFQHVELCTNEASSGPCAVEKEEIEMILDTDVKNSTFSTFFPSYCRQNLMLHRAEPWLFPFSHASKHKNPSEDDSASLSPLAVMQIFPKCVSEHSQGALVRSEECELAEMSRGRVVDLSEEGGRNKPSSSSNKLAALNMKRELRGLPPLPSLPPSEGAVQTKSSEQEEAQPAGYLEEIDHLVFLGTGAAAPSRLRSCSGILLSIPGTSVGSREVNGKTRILLDCGEGCLSRLMQIASNVGKRNVRGKFGEGKGEEGRKETEEGKGEWKEKGKRKVEGKLDEIRSCPTWRWHDFLMEIKMVWISHMHADHHSGLLSLLYHRLLAQECPACRRETKQLRMEDQGQGQEQEDVLIVGPHALKQVVESYHHVIRGNSNVSASLACKHFTDCNRHVLFPSFHLRSLPVFHSHDAHAAILRFQSRSNGKEEVIITYSGDTRPSMQLVEETMRMVEEHQEEERRKTAGGEGGGAARACVLLIHEATFDSDQLEHAKRKRHSTVGEAIQVGEQLRERLRRRMGMSRLCYGTILSHFSQRYPNIFSLDLTAGSAPSTTTIAAAATTTTAATSSSSSPPLAVPVMLASDGLFLPLEFERMRQVFDRSALLLDRLAKVKEAMKDSKGEG